MIKRTLYFGNPAYLSKKDNQLIVKLPEVEKNNTLPDNFKKEATASIPIEDIGIVVIDHQQVVVSHALVNALIDNKAAVLWCDEKHIPNGLVLPMSGNNTFTEKLRYQLDASEPLKKQLWKQTVSQKIANQAEVLKQSGKHYENMLFWSSEVNSGDTFNVEAKAAAYYWKTIFDETLFFIRDREGMPPNNLLNYGYAIFRAVAARSLVISGCLPALGIHHRNKYNAFCLADDIMEPYRPYVDKMVLDIIDENKGIIPEELTKEIKAKLLSLPTIDVEIEEQTSPLMIAMQRTTSSLMKCFTGELRKISFPKL